MAWKYIPLACLALVSYSQARCTYTQVTICQEKFLPHTEKNLTGNLAAESLKRTCESVEPTLTCLEKFHEPCSSHLTYTSIVASVEAIQYVCTTEERKSAYLEALECLKNKNESIKAEIDECMRPIEGIRDHAKIDKPKECQKFKTAFQCYHDVLKAACGANAADVKKKYEIRFREHETKPLNCTVEPEEPVNTGAATGLVSLLLMGISMFLAVLVL